MFAILASCSASVSRQEADGNPQELIYLKHSVCKYLTTLTFKLNARIIKVTCYLNSAGVRCTDTALNSTRRLRTNTSCRQKHRGHKTPLRHQAARQRIGTISAGSVAAILLSKGDPCVPSQQSCCPTRPASMRTCNVPHPTTATITPCRKNITEHRRRNGEAEGISNVGYPTPILTSLTNLANLVRKYCHDHVILSFMINPASLAGGYFEGVVYI